MTAANFTNDLDLTLKYEGGLSMLRSDPGNWTGGKVNKGVLKGTNFGIAASSHPSLDIKGLTKAQAGEIYRKEYWNPVRGDDLPMGVDAVTFDFAVNSGVSRAAKALQTAAGASADGKLGAGTMLAIERKAPVVLVKAICDARLSFLHALATWKTFGKGWGARVGDIRARAILMATNGDIATVKKDTAELDAKAHEANSQAKKSVAAGPVAAGGGVVADQVHAIDPTLLMWGAAGVVVLAIIAALIFSHRATVHAAAAKAAEKVIAEAEGALVQAKGT